MRDSISIIVKVYNEEKYLEKCIDSILNQSYQNLEIILIDDGSTDNSGSICDEYKKKDKRVQVIHQKNQGQSSARNAGLNIAKGSYIGFVDSDDWIEQNMYEKLYKNICLYNADIATCSYVLEYEDNNIKTTELEEQLLELFEKKNQKMLLKNFLNRELYFSGPCDKLYRMSIFENIRFPENQFYEDNYIALELMLKAEKIAVGNGKYYHYRQHINSTTKSYSDKKYHDAISAEMHNIKIVERFYPELVKFAHAPLYLRYFQFLDLLIFDSYSNIKAIQLIRSNIQNNIKNIILLENLNIKEKIALTMMAVNLVLYKMVRSLQKKSRGY